MPKSAKPVHRGKVLQKVAEEHDISVVKLVKKVGYSRTSYYYHILQPDLSFDILQQYGEAMYYDFTKHFPEMAKHLSKQSSISFRKARTYEEALKERDYWFNKYNALVLEGYWQKIKIK